MNLYSGRKPGSRSAKDPLTYLKDKALRKKEQNKTAATRYRLKKKQELAVTLTQEEELQKEHDELSAEKEDIRRQVIMVRQLLREMIKANKKKKSGPSRVTASTLFQVNRRKWYVVA